MVLSLSVECSLTAGLASPSAGSYLDRTQKFDCMDLSPTDVGEPKQYALLQTQHAHAPFFNAYRPPARQLRQCTW